MKILVTGASGFVGQALIKALELSDMSVVKVTRRSFYDLTSGACYVIPDLAKFTNWKSLLLGCDVIIHLAARVHIMNDRALDPLAEFVKINVNDTVNLAKQAALFGVKRFVFISSIKVNGEHAKNATFSESSPPDPQDPYAISKYRAELALLELSKSTGMEVVIVRPPLVYGPEVKANFLILMNIINKKIPLPLGGIHNKLSLVYVGNLVDALIRCATHPNAVGKIFLVSDGEDISTTELMKKIAIALTKPYRVFYFPIRLMRALAQLAGKKASIDRLTQSLVIDSSKIREELDWRPPYTMDQGLQTTAKWYVENLQAIKNC